MVSVHQIAFFIPLQWRKTSIFAPESYIFSWLGSGRSFLLQAISIQNIPWWEKVVRKMPRMSKQKKEEWDFFLDENGRITYNELCRKCDRDCKQSFRAIIASCPEYNSKRRKQKKWFVITTISFRRCGLFYCSRVGTERDLGWFQARYAR